MHAQPGDRDCTKEAIGGNHFGPVIIYMSKVADATTSDGSGQWFKVAQDGYNPTTKVWGTVRAPSMSNYMITTKTEQMTLNANCGKRTFTVPSTLAPGNYLLRAEVIALHVASQVGGAQFYMSCYQLQVTGSGNKVPSSGLVTFPGAYSANDPGILINIYYPAVTNYIIPGPTAVFTG